MSAMKKSGGNAGLKMSVRKGELGGQPVEPGIYEARFNSEMVTSSTGKPMVKATYSLFGVAPSGANVTGRKVFDNIVIQQETLWKLNQPYAAVKGEDLPEGDFTVDELYQIFKDVTENAKLTVDVGTESYTGKDEVEKERNNIKKIL